MPMPMNGYNYLPPTPGYFAIVVVYVIVGVLLISTLCHAYQSLGSGAALLLLFGSLVGSYFNVPLAQLPAEHVMSEQVRDFYGMVYAVPRVLIEQIRPPLAAPLASRYLEAI
jgi:uncharacterized membrane protein